MFTYKDFVSLICDSAKAGYIQIILKCKRENMCFRDWWSLFVDFQRWCISIQFLPFRFQSITVKKVAYVWMTRYYYSIIMPFKKVDFSNYDLWQCVLFESLRDCYFACCGIENFLGLRVIQETTILQNTWCFKLIDILEGVHNLLDTFIVSVWCYAYWPLT